MSFRKVVEASVISFLLLSGCTLSTEKTAVPFKASTFFEGCGNPNLQADIAFDDNSFAVLYCNAENSEGPHYSSSIETSELGLVEVCHRIKNNFGYPLPILTFDIPKNADLDPLDSEVSMEKSAVFYYGDSTLFKSFTYNPKFENIPPQSVAAFCYIARLRR